MTKINENRPMSSTIKDCKRGLRAFEQSYGTRCLPLRRAINACVQNALEGGANVSVSELLDEFEMLFPSDTQLPIIDKLMDIEVLSQELGVTVMLPSLKDWKDDRFNEEAVDEVLTALKEKREIGGIVQDWMSKARRNRMAGKKTRPDSFADYLKSSWISSGRHRRFDEWMREYEDTYTS